MTYRSKLLALISTFAVGIADQVWASDSYTTNFPATENPLSENGRWINGKTVGLDWQDFRVTSGFATFNVSNVSSYDDTTAIVAGNWGPDQYVRTVVHKPAADPNYAQEIEIRLRTSITAHSCTGYEVLAGSQIVRWNGAIGDFTVLNDEGPHGALNDGDVFEARIVGNEITVFINGVLVNRVVDGTFTSGRPGIGLFTRNPSPTPFGFSSFTASNSPIGTSRTPSPPTSLSAH